MLGDLAAGVRLEAAQLAIHLKVIPLLEGMSHVVQNFQGSGRGCLSICSCPIREIEK